MQETKLDNRYEKKVRLSKVQITVGGMAIILLISTCGYFVNATTNWFTGFPLKNKYQTLNATAYIENAIPEDAAAIRWLNKILQVSQPFLKLAATVIKTMTTGFLL